MFMLPKLITISDEKAKTNPQDDEYDAIAIGITALAYMPNSVVKR
jgi:Holliday junction resolvasome RuvABC endonuclease subunit